jgi:diguanylate cyclase (GGDEF)-like protein
MKTIFNILDNKKPRYIWLLSVFAIALISAAISLVKNHVDLRLLLIIPVLLASWYGGRKTGAAIALLSAIAFFTTDFSPHFYNLSTISPGYDLLVAALVYLFISIIVTNFRKVHSVEIVAADTDTLTGVSSSRKFYTDLENEINRSRRYGHSFALVYLDVDDFKNINDALGHPIGDELLIRLSKSLPTSLRATDIIARIGGDEFVCLLPETEQVAAKSALLKAEKALKGSMEKYGWDVSFSIGVITFEKPPIDAAQAVKLVDDLMYKVKRGNKNDIAYQVWQDIA